MTWAVTVFVLHVSPQRHNLYMALGLFVLSTYRLEKCWVLQTIVGHSITNALAEYWITE